MSPVTIEPHPVQHLLLTDAESAAGRAAVEQIRAEHAAGRERSLPYRRRLLEASGIPLRDVEAALDCVCGCHPTISLGTHDGGSSCACQLTVEERSAKASQLLALPPDPRYAAAAQASRDALALRANELGVDAVLTSQWVPFVITGAVDGRGFCLRERHDSWRVTVGPDDNPGLDPWTAEPSQLVLDLADGDSFRLSDEKGALDVVKALDVAVAAVRSYLRQSACDHQAAPPASRYCPTCGTALVPAFMP